MAEYEEICGHNRAVFGENQANLLSAAYNFFENEVGAAVDIQDFFYLGKSEPKPIVITLGSIEQKDLVFQNKKNIKELVNIDGKPIFINDYVPAEIGENRKRQREIYGENQNSDASSKLEMKYQSGKLMIEDQVYSKKVTAPTVRRIIELKGKEKEKIMQSENVQGEELFVEDSIFIGYTGKVFCHEDVDKLYTKIRLLHPKARHVVCAYRTPGTKKCYDNDYNDDQESGAGRKLLAWMKSNNLECRAVLVVRYCGKSKLALRGSSTTP